MVVGLVAVSLRRMVLKKLSGAFQSGGLQAGGLPGGKGWGMGHSRDSRTPVWPKIGKAKKKRTERCD